MYYRRSNETHLWGDNTRRGVIASTAQVEQHSSSTRRMHVCTKAKRTDTSTKYLIRVRFGIRGPNNGLDGRHNVNTDMTGRHIWGRPIITRSHFFGRNDQI